jgi:HEAT repeat protein
VGLFGGPNIEKLTAKRDLHGLAKALTNGDPQVREQAAGALEEIGDASAVPEVVAALAGKNDEAMADNAGAALRGIGDDAARALAQGLRSARDDKRPIYGALLGRMGEERGLAPLVEASRDGGPEVRATAALGLGLIKTQGAADRLVEVLRADDDVDVRGMACLALASHKLPGAYEAFTAGLQGGDPLDRALGAMGLGMLGDPRAVPALDGVANDDDDERVRDAARKSLADLPAARA